MTTDDLPQTPEDRADLLAAEYVLGVLPLSERLAVEAQMKTDSAFAQRVAAWEARLAPLNDDFAEVPAPDLMPKIEARLFPTPARPARRSLFGWLVSGVLGATTAVALVLVGMALLVPPSAGTLVAVLGEAEASLRFEARFDGAALTVIRVAGGAAPDGQVQEVWLIAPDAAPVSLGLLPGDRLAVPYPAAPVGWTLAVSLEPAGGSPTGAPTGPVLAAGVITDL